MKIKHKDPIIDPENPFANCVLGRSQHADTLTGIVKNYADGFVLAINSEWGTGKTTFVKMWRQQLKKEEFQTLYFNAWENDFESNPLIAFLAELKKLVETDSKEQFKSLLQKGAVIVKNIAPVMVKAFADKYISTDILKEVLVEGTKGATNLLENEINEYTKKKDGIKDFRNSLEKFIELVNDGKPLIFIIDELDRCRPNYAVGLLEQIKHFFSVSGIVFVLSIDKEQLGHAIRGVYGSDRLNADEYLRRFIDLEYTIPRPHTGAFVRYLYRYFEFDSFFRSDERIDYGNSGNDSHDFIDFASIVFENSGATLRQQEKIFAQARLIVPSYHYNQPIFPSLLIALIFFKSIIPDFYNHLRSKKFSIQELLLQLAQKVPRPTNENQTKFYIHLEATLAYLYYKYAIGYSKFELLTTDSATHISTASVSSTFDKSENQGEFVRILKALFLKYDYGEITLETVFNKIELIESVKL